MHPASGPQNSHAWACSMNTPPSLRASNTALTSASQQLAKHIPHLIISLYHATQLFPKYIIPPLSTSSNLAATSAPSHKHSWRLSWVRSRPPPFRSSPRHPNQANTGQYTISPSRTTPRRRQISSTHTLTARTSRAHGARLPQSRCSSPTYPLGHRHQCVMWWKPTGLSQPTRRNGLAWSSTCRQRTSLLLTSATTSALPQQEAFTEQLQMLAQTSSVATGWGPY